MCTLISFFKVQNCCKQYLVLALLLCTSMTLFAQDETIAAISLDGTWTIDLRPSADAPAYIKEFVIHLKDDGSFTGEFYDSRISNGLINRNWEKIYFAFSTSDQSNEYFHSGYLLNGTIYGLSYCPNRDFVMPWTGMKFE